LNIPMKNGLWIMTYWSQGNVNPFVIYITYNFKTGTVTLGQTYGDKLEVIDWASSPFGDD
jgi:hypothetical protein